MGMQIAVIGDVMLDIYHYCSNRENPESSAPCYTVQRTEYKPGGAGNVVANLAKLGSLCKIVSITGKDTESKKLESLLEKLGIETFFIKDDTRQTTVKERFLSCSDNRYHFRADFEQKKYIDSNHTNQILEQLNNVDLIIISDYNKGIISEHLISELSKRKIEIAADIKPVHKSFFRGGKAKFIKPNSKEAIEMTHINNDLEAAKNLRNELSSNIILTRGKNGIAYFSLDGEFYEEPSSISPDRVVDVTGAGDSVLAAFCHFYVKGCSIQECIRYANIAGGISVQYPGCYHVSEKEILSHSP